MRVLTFNSIRNYVDTLKKNTLLFNTVQDVRKKMQTAFGHMSLDEATHTYTSSKDPEKKYISVTKLIEKFKQEDDWDMIAEKFAVKNKRETEDVKDEWMFTGMKSRALGTKTHGFGEAICIAITKYMDGENEENIIKHMMSLLGRQIDKTDAGEYCFVPITVNEEKVAGFWMDIVNCDRIALVPVSAELKIENDNLGGYAGCIDLLMWSVDTNKLVVMDYKTNGTLESTFNRKNNTRLLSPFSELISESLSEYTLQLAYYARAIIDAGIMTKDDLDDFILIHVNSTGGKYGAKPEYNLVRTMSMMYIDRLV